MIGGVLLDSFFLLCHPVIILVIISLGKKNSQLFTFAEIVRNNGDIFCKQYPRMPGEPENHYICKSYLGEMLRKFYQTKIDLVISYEHPLPQLLTADNGPRSYIPDIYIEYLNNGDNKIHISDIEINGAVHYKNKKQYSKNKLRRETIINYFDRDYKDNKYPEYKIIFSYLVFNVDDFLYNKFDFFKEIFEEKFMNGGHYFEY